MLFDSRGVTCIKIFLCTFNPVITLVSKTQVNFKKVHKKATISISKYSTRAYYIRDKKCNVWSLFQLEKMIDFSQQVWQINYSLTMNTHKKIVNVPSEEHVIFITQCTILYWRCHVSTVRVYRFSKLWYLMITVQLLSKMLIFTFSPYITIISRTQFKFQKAY